MVRASHTDRQSTLLARVDGVVDPEWTVHDVTLEDLILAYLGDGETTADRTEWEVPA
ncbi:hypothetical protein ONA70_06720 [Micromonospora yasonensis]|uniref:hypothetical protein n=1 Tax=Micromonospora yasonensis TaxID=1128667 RepID=UPI00222F1B19|nr:hypothetical protein [Micromonospora yasonensis]MCW3839788.1 hypothetical protein [Micromonospora yasonensis]